MAALLAFGTATSVDAAPPPTIAWPDTPPPPPPRISATTASDDGAVRDVLRHDPEIGRRYRQGRNVIIGGAVSLGSAGGTLIMASIFALVAEVEAKESELDGNDGARARSLAVGFALTSAMLVTIGVPLVIAGARRRNDAIADARHRVSLGMGPRGLGLRF